MRNTAPRRINPANGRNSYSYIRGSVATAYPQEDYTYRQPRPRRRKVRPAPVVTDSYTRLQEKINPSVIYPLLGIVVVFAFMIALLSVNERISLVKNEIRQTQALTKKTESVNAQLENMLSNAVDMEEVKRTAITKLGMQSAAPYQIVNINVEKDSYSIQYDDQAASAEKKTFLEWVGIK